MSSHQPPEETHLRWHGKGMPLVQQQYNAQDTILSHNKIDRMRLLGAENDFFEEKSPFS